MTARDRSRLRDGVAAGALAGIVGGAPSTLHAILTGRDPLESTMAAGTILVPRARRRAALLGTGLAIHAVLSLVWGIVLTWVLPRRRAPAWGAVGGIAIAALDLGLVGRRLPRIRSLPIVPHLVDHIAFGTTVGLAVWRMSRAEDALDSSGAARVSGAAGPGRTEWAAVTVTAGVPMVS